MKKYIFHTLFAGAAIFFAGCADEIEQFTPKRSGDEIVFGGRATYELSENKNQKAPATRTVYTGTFLGADGQTWTSGTKYEVIHWESGDKVRIYSAEAAGTTVADYTVNVNDEDATGAAELSKIGAAGLQWSDETSYDFYAVYPSPYQYPLKDGELDSDVNEAVLNNSKTILGRIPVVQGCKGSPVKSGTSWTLTPKMEYAYMVAHQKVEDVQKTGAEIYLNFVPIATAVEIELVNKSKDELELANILVSSAAGDAALTGDFTADLSSLPIGSKDNIDTEIPTENFITAVSNTGTQISIPAYQGEGGLVGDPIVLADNGSIKFTLFMLPNQNVDDLKITLVGIEGNRIGATSGITITKHKKTFLNQMPISVKQGDYDQSRWIEFLPDNAYLKGLSIPGAGGAASSNSYGTALSDYLRQQDLGISDLWNQGIRCFEFSVDIASNTTDADGNITAYGDISEQKVLCNGQECGLTLQGAVSAVKTELEDHPEEFAMVILTYQTLGGYDERDPHSFMKQLNTFWKDVAEGTHDPWDTEKGCGTALYVPTTANVGDSRGALFCIARPTSQYQDYGDEIVTGLSDFNWDSYAGKVNVTSKTYEDLNVEAPRNDIMVIKGWGALKDKWQQRGFSHQSQRGTNNSYDGKPGRPFDCASVSILGSGTGITTSNYTIETTELTPDFRYDVLAGNNTVTTRAWVQEWARVSNMSSPYNYGSSGLWQRGYIYWASSYDEKLQRVKECLGYSIAGKVSSYESDEFSVFINSLCGYFIDTGTEQSYIPCTITDWNANSGNATSGYNQLSLESDEGKTAGMYGDIATFASTINSAFYTHLQSLTSSYVPGPMGIILMDRVSSDKEDNGSKIPSIIIANNFQHTLPSAPATLSLPRTDLEDGDVVAAPQRRDANDESKGMSITWE